MTTHSLPSDSTARRLRSLEIQNYLIKAAVVVLMLLLLWRTFSGSPAPAPVAPEAADPAAPVASGAPAEAAPELPQDKSLEKSPTATLDALTAASLKSPVAAVAAPAGAPRNETKPAPSVAEPKAPVVKGDLSAAQVYRTTQRLIETTFRDPRYSVRFAEAWKQRTHANPSSNFVFPQPFVGQVVGPTPQPEGYRDYQVWGDGLVDGEAQQPSGVWYMVLWNFDPATSRAYVESLSIGGKEIVRDWRPYSKERVSVVVE